MEFGRKRNVDPYQGIKHINFGCFIPSIKSTYMQKDLKMTYRVKCMHVTYSGAVDS